MQSYHFILITFATFLIQTVQNRSIIANIDEDCLQCICKANTGCNSGINECFEDDNDEIRCGAFLLRESQWNQIQNDSFIKLRQSNISRFDECYSNYGCASDLVNAFTLHSLLSNSSEHLYNVTSNRKLTCADVAIHSQFGGQSLNQRQSKQYEQYATVLKSHQCMNKTLTNFQTKLMIHRLNLNPEKQNLNVSIVPRRCFDCIRTANNYNYGENVEKQRLNERCIHPLHKCGPYAINFEYFLQVNGNQVTRSILAPLYNESSEFENQNQLLDTIDLLNKLTYKDGSKHFRNEFDRTDDEKVDYNKKLSQLLHLDTYTNYLHESRSMQQFEISSRPVRRKNSKLLIKLVSNGGPKSRRNSKFSKESNSEEQATNIIKQSVQKLIESSSYQNFANCAINLQCSEQLINLYVKQHLVDCNLDSTIDCDDFASIHWLGNKCTFLLKQNTMLYSNLWKQFEYCSILADDVRKEEISYNTDKSYYNYELPLPNFQVRPNNNLTNDQTIANQYYSNNYVDLSNDCLQCICEASSDNYNCTQIVANRLTSSYYSSNILQPQPPRIVYLKTNNRMPKEDYHLIDVEKGDYNPFGITKYHFLESMVSTFWYKGAAGDWERCAESVDCSIETISKYVTRFSKDCTKDGRLSCADFALIHRYRSNCSDLNTLDIDYNYSHKLDKCLSKFGIN